MTTTTPAEISSPLSALRYAVGTDVGRRREENQDSFGIIEGQNYRFFIVPDGMGGAKGSGTASNLAIETVRGGLNELSSLEPRNITEWVMRANQEIFTRGSADEALNGMGTTFVGLAFAGTKLYIANVGDSRAYLIREDEIRQLTEDHTLVRELLRSGAISSEQADHHPVAHMLTRSLGPTPEVAVDCSEWGYGPARGDVFLLCSDGLYNLVEPHDMLHIVQENSLDEAVEKLINLANERGGTDNITVILIQVGEEFPRQASDYPDLEPVEELGAEVGITSGAEAVEPTASNGGSSDPSTLQGYRRSQGMNASPTAARQGSPFSDYEMDIRARPTRSSAEAQPEGTSSGKEVVVRSSMLMFWSKILAYGMCMAVVGAIGMEYLSRRAAEVEQPRIAINPLAAIAARTRVRLASEDLRQQLQLVALYDPSTYQIGAQPGSIGDRSNNATASSLRAPANVPDRRQVLSGYIAELEEKIAALDGPLTGETAQRAKEATQQIATLERNLNSLRDDLDRATRKLSVWFGRRQRLDRTDPVDLASEVSVSSDSVKERKELFERATWSYLKEVEIWRFNPADETLTKRVSELGRIREQRRKDLGAEVRSAIEQAVEQAEHEIADVSARRDDTQSKLDAANRDIKFVKILTSSNPQAKAEKKAELQRERELAVAELAELERMAVGGENLRLPADN